MFVDLLNVLSRLVDLINLHLDSIVFVDLLVYI